MWLQMPNYRKMMALNTRLSNGFECQTEDVTLNIERKKDMMALNVELKKTTTLNAKLKMLF